MPIYEYSCECGLVTDYICHIADRPEGVLCEKCGRQAKFIMSAPMIQADDIVNVPWIREFAKSRPEARFGKKTIETRTEYKKYLKDNGLRSADGPNLSEV